MGQVHVLTGPVRRRIWLPEEKAALVAAAFAPGAVVAEVARRADVKACIRYIARLRPQDDVSLQVQDEYGRVVIPPFLTGSEHRIHAANFSFWAGVIPPMPILGRSWL